MNEDDARIELDRMDKSFRKRDKDAEIASLQAKLDELHNIYETDVTKLQHHIQVLQSKLDDALEAMRKLSHPWDVTFGNQNIVPEALKRLEEK